MLKLISLFVYKKYNKNLPLISTNECVGYTRNEKERGLSKQEIYDRERERDALFGKAFPRPFPLLFFITIFQKKSTSKHS